MSSKSKGKNTSHLGLNCFGCSVGNRWLKNEVWDLFPIKMSATFKFSPTSKQDPFRRKRFHRGLLAARLLTVIKPPISLTQRCGCSGWCPNHLPERTPSARSATATACCSDNLSARTAEDNRRWWRPILTKPELIERHVRQWTACWYNKGGAAVFELFKTFTAEKIKKFRVIHVVLISF